MGSACGHQNVEGGRKVIVDVYREIKRMRDAALRNEIKDGVDMPCSVRAAPIF